MHPWKGLILENWLKNIFERNNFKKFPGYQLDASRSPRLLVVQPLKLVF